MYVYTCIHVYIYIEGRGVEGWGGGAALTSSLPSPDIRFCSDANMSSSET